MKICVIAGSHRPESESLRVARYVEGALRRLNAEEVVVVSLSDNPLPLWDEGVWSGRETWRRSWGPIAAELDSSEGFVVVAPEWSGMVPPALKNFFLLCDKQLLAHKPALIIGISAGQGGAYPISELRISSYKNTRICFLPDHVIVRNVGTMLLDDKPASPADESIRVRIDYSLRVLLEYGKALRLVRASGVVNFQDSPFGM